MSRLLAVINTTRTTLCEYNGAWGNILSITGNYADTLGKLNPLRYRGYVYDQPTGLYYLQSRYYDPEIGRFINADVFASTGQGLLGHNMFAYCGNNPVSRKDSTGHAFVQMTFDPTGISGMLTPGPSGGGSGGVGYGSGAASGVLLLGGVVVIGIAIGPSLVEAFEETAEKIIEWVEAQVTKKEPRDNSVYILRDPNDGNLVKYVGRTNDPNRRIYEHQHDPFHPWRQNYTMTVVATGLTKGEAMLFEQTLISAYTLDYLENARREIASKNVGKSQNYLAAVSEILTGLPAGDIYELIVGR